jgi:anthranilate phosphoribosyltransferase
MVRKTLGVRTIFNVLGPFANPAGTTRQLIGVPSEVVAARMAEAGAALGYERLIIATGGGLDEISTGEVSKIFEVNGGDVKKYDLDPARYGFKAAPAGALRGGDASYNAEVTRSVLGGAMGPQRDVVVLNSAVALQAAGMAETVAEGVKQAADSIDGGKARGVLERLVVETGRYA